MLLTEQNNREAEIWDRMGWKRRAAHLLIRGPFVLAGCLDHLPVMMFLELKLQISFCLDAPIDGDLCSLR